MEKQKFIFIAGGSFQGKSLIALHLANKYQFSGVVTTDMIRNILRIHATPKDKRRYFSTSTYRMPSEDLMIQKKLVSNEVKQLLPIYIKRGEKIIFEGMHFSDAFIKNYLAKKDYLRIFIDNEIGLSQRVELKRITRNKLNLKYEMDNFNYNSTVYSNYEDRIIEIHSQMKEVCKKNGFHIVCFTNMEEGKKKCEALVDDYLK